jgi:hypothetical protein
MSKRVGVGLFLALWLFPACAALAVTDPNDAEGTKDPLFTRMPGWHHRHHRQGSGLRRLLRHRKGRDQARVGTVVEGDRHAPSESPLLRLYVVGHTDNAGGFDHNLALSKDRAGAVVAALTGKYAIAASRLQPFGAGPTAPAASNTNEEGRAKNRRVELVAQ